MNRFARVEIPAIVVPPFEGADYYLPVRQWGRDRAPLFGEDRPRRRGIGPTQCHCRKIVVTNTDRYLDVKIADFVVDQRLESVERALSSVSLYVDLGRQDDH